MREMVEAMALLPSSLPAQLDLAGPAVQDEAEFLDLHHHPGWARVHHHGFIDQKSAFQILRKTRAGLVLYHPEPNQVESIPQKIFEYMAAGVPLIASDFPLWRQIIGEAGCGIFVNPLKPREIAKAIEFVMTHPQEAEQMGRRGQASVLKRFNWDSEAEKLVQLYKTLTAEVQEHAIASPIPSTN
jgi:glycosyltransferase involved in cell wall biosynthesis